MFCYPKILKGEQKKPKKSFDLFLCLDPGFRGRKWVLAGKINFFILWSKVKKQMENTKNSFMTSVFLGHFDHHIKFHKDPSFRC